MENRIDEQLERISEAVKVESTGNVPKEFGEYLLVFQSSSVKHPIGPSLPVNNRPPTR